MSTSEIVESLSLYNCKELKVFEVLNENISPDVYFIHAIYSDNAGKCFLYNVKTKKELHRFNTQNAPLCYSKDVINISGNINVFINSGRYLLLLMIKLLSSTNQLQISISRFEITCLENTFNINEDKFYHDIKLHQTGISNGIYILNANKLYIGSTNGQNNCNYYNLSRSIIFDIPNIEIIKDLSGYMITTTTKTYNQISMICKSYINSYTSRSYTKHTENDILNIAHNIPNSIPVINNELIVLSGLNDFIIYDYIHDNEIRKIDRKYTLTSNQNGFNNPSVINILNDNILSVTHHISATSKNIVLYRLKDNDEIPEAEQCVICMNRTKKNKILVPCGHTQYCQKCISDLKVCSICRTKVGSIIKIYT